LTRARATLASLLAILAAWTLCPSLAAQGIDFQASGSAEASFGFFAQKDDLTEAAAIGEGLSSIEFTLAAGGIELRAKGAIAAATGDAPATAVIKSYWSDRLPLFPEARGGVAVSLNELMASFDGLPGLKLAAGRFMSAAGSADLFPCVDFWSRSAPERLLAGGSGASLPADLAQATLYLDTLYLKLSASPFRPAMVVIDPSSPWFPRGSLKTPNLDLSFLDVVLEREQAPWSLSEASWSAEFGFSAGDFDIAAIVYDGWDPSSFLLPVWKGFTSSEIALRETYRRIFAMGLTTSATFGGWRFKLDAAYCPARAHLYDTYGVGIIWEALERPTLEVTAGFEWFPPLPSTTIFAEYRETFIQDDPGVKRGYLSSAAGAGARAAFLDSRLTAQALFVASPVAEDLAADGSRPILAAPGFLALLEARWTPSAEIEYRIGLPIFWGDPSSFLGSYAEYRYASGGVIVRFY
jgi:hypothetical protein